MDEFLLIFLGEKTFNELVKIFDVAINVVVRASFFQLMTLEKVKPFLSSTDFDKVIYSVFLFSPIQSNPVQLYL